MAKSTLIVNAEAGTVDRLMPNGELRKNVGNLCQGYRQIWIDGTMVNAHRVVWEHVHGAIPSGKEVDHINGQRSDNRIANLRLVTRAENLQNRHAPRKNSRSGVKGVIWNEQSQLWRAIIMNRGVRHHLGSFKTIAAAGAAYAKAAAIHHTHNPSAKGSHNA